MWRDLDGRLLTLVAFLLALGALVSVAAGAGERRAVVDAPDRAALATLSGQAEPVVYLREAGRQGLFRWDNADLSDVLIARTGVTSSVDPATNRASVLRHGLRTGDVIVGADTSDLDPNTRYYVIAEEDTPLDRGTGSWIGDTTANGSFPAAFDGVISEPASSAAGKPAASVAFVGKSLPAGMAFTRAVVYGSSNQGFVVGVDPMVTLTAYCGTGSLPAAHDDSDREPFGAISFADTADESAGREIVFADFTTECDHIWVALETDSNAFVSIAEVVFYRSSEPSTFQLAATHADALSGTELDLTVATNFSYEQLVDPAQAVFVPPSESTQADLTGKNGAWKRQFDGWVDPRWAGAAVDGTTDDTGAYHAVRSLVDVLGYPLRIPPGRSILTGKLAFTDAVVIEGAAAGRSFLRWPASVTGIGATNRIGIDISGVSQAVRSERLKVEGISFERAGAAPGVSGRALTVRCLACEPSVGSILPSVVLNDLEFTGLQVKTQSFQWGIHLNEVQGAFVDNVSYRGSFDTSYPTVRYGTAIRADNVEGGNPFGLMVSKLVVLTAQFGVDIQESEGAKITGSDLVAVNTGIRWRPGVVGVGQPGLTVMGNHINAYDYGIDAKGNHQAIISDNLIYRRPDANGAFACVRLTDARFPSVGRNLCADANPTVGTRSVGIEFVNVDHYLIAPNNFQLGDTCISVDENSDGGTIDFQQIRTDAWTTLLDYSGSGARIRGRGGYATVATGAALTLVPWRDPETIRHVGRLKADETVTLSTANAYPGANFRISREGGGAFHLNVGPGPLCSLARGDWCVVVYDGSAWYRAEAGSRF